MNANDLVGRDAAVLRVRGALAFTDATRPGAGGSLTRRFSFATEKSLKSE